MLSLILAGLLSAAPPEAAPEPTPPAAAAEPAPESTPPAAAAEPAPESPPPAAAAPAPTPAPASTPALVDTAWRSADTHRAPVHRCGSDRRCRLEQLKAKNKQRRRVHLKEIDEKVERLAEERRARQVENFRGDKPFVLTWDITRLGGLGGTFGYAFTSWMRIDLLFRWSPFGRHVNESSYTQDSSSWSSVNLSGDVFWGGAGATFFPVSLQVLTGALSPYLGAHLLMGFGHVTGNISEGSYSWDPDTGEYSQDVQDEYVSAGARFDSVKLTVGVHWQIRLGMHVGLGFIFRQPFYVQARLGQGEYSEPLKEKLHEWHEDAARFDFSLQLGWAF